MAIPNLWPADLGAATATPPIAILREQADALTRVTKGLVVGSVRSSRLEDGTSFSHDFLLKVPALDDYRYMLFAVCHSPEMYPATVYYPANGREPEECPTEERLLEALRDVLAHESTRRVVSALMAQAAVSKP